MQSSASGRTYPQARPVPLLLLRELTVDDSGAEARAPAPSGASTTAPEAASDWKQVHGQLVSLGKTRAAHEREVCRSLLAALRLGVHARVGYASHVELAERLLGLNGRETEERLRVGRALDTLRLLDAALASGELSWSAVRELTRVATQKTEQAWLEWAKHRRVRQIEMAVAGRRPGDGPLDRADPSRIRHRLSFEVRPETMALFRDLQSAVRADLGSDLDDDALLREIARRALGGPDDAGRASYQIALSRCDECGRSSIEAGGETFPADDVTVEMAACDSQHLPPPTDPARPHVGAPRPKATQTASPALRRDVLRRDGNRCVLPGCRSHRYLDVHHVDPRCEGGSNDPERLAALCGQHHRAVHSGALVIEGTAADGFVFRHGDGTPYGADIHPSTLDHASQAQAALQRMGFTSKQARDRIDKALRHEAPASFIELMRAALRAS